MLKQILQDNLTLYREAFSLIEREGQDWRRACGALPRASFEMKKVLLPRLAQSLDELRLHRISWQKLSPAERRESPEIASLMRQSQDLIMKTILLDRENEQTLLRRGLLPPQSVPPANRQRPHFVAGLYRRQSAT